ncbi:MAG TPA: ABC transporter permease [Steroidobacteraceae bacterium]
MIGYYFNLAIRCLRANVALTVLIIAAVGVGIGATMTVFTVLLAMSGDPIPAKSSQLFAAQIDVWGPPSRKNDSPNQSRLPDMLPYHDAVALMQAHAAIRQAAMYGISQVILPPRGEPIPRGGRATYRDFFAMFQVPFQSGAPWSVQDEASHRNVVVLGANLAAKLFPAGNAVGQVITMEAGAFRVVGVLEPWSPQPLFYDPRGSAFGRDDGFFIPFTVAIEHELPGNSLSCHTHLGSDWAARLASSCVWIQFWAELPDGASERAFRRFLGNYAADQQQSGRFGWPPLVQLSNVRQWLQIEHVVPDEVRINALLALGFLLVCLVNAVGLMLARFAGRSGAYAIRRALGASWSDIFLQCMVETAVVGVLGGVLGLMLTGLGLAGQRTTLKTVSAYTAQMTHLDPDVMALTVVLAIGVTFLSGLYPAWRAARTAIAWQLKEQ